MRKISFTSLPIVADHVGFTRQIMYLAWMDIYKSYRGALLGWFWVLAKPLMLLGFYWFIVVIGFHSDKMHGHHYRYLPWLVTGLCAWFFISDMINGGTGAFRKYKFLVAKTKFPVATIPTIVTLSNFMVHLALLAVVLVYLALSGYMAVQWLQLPLYVAFSVVLMWFWSLLAAPLGAISKDFTQIVKSMMRVLVWLSGILWSTEYVKVGWLRNILELNPIWIVTEGYRKSLVYHTWFFNDRRELLIFVVELALLAVMAIVIFQQSRKEVVDVL